MAQFTGVNVTRPEWVKIMMCKIFRITYILSEKSFVKRALVDQVPLTYIFWLNKKNYHSKSLKLEQLERLRSEDTPRRLMITHTIESYWIPSQKKTKSKL